ncbi:MAG: heme-binding domain-containing protein [Acidobacteria bacterium]|nr:heme-binding domain-containing protein [Acidobacteriota bacterium]
MSRLSKGFILKTGVLAVALFAVVQVVPYRISNPAARADPPWDSPTTRDLALRACADCHSNRTRVVWYEHVAPVSWWIKGHVDEGRSALNFDKWPSGLGEGAHDAAETVRDGSMPPSYYTWFGLHSNARLTAAERDQLARGLLATLGSRSRP